MREREGRASVLVDVFNCDKRVDRSINAQREGERKKVEQQ